jgi:hypothetical protein
MTDSLTSDSDQSERISDGENGHVRRKTWPNLDRFEQVVRIGVLMLSPAILGVFGVWIQSTVQSDSINKDYVELAVQILSTADDKVDISLRAWAVDVLGKLSPVPLADAVRLGLGQGGIVIPTQQPTLTLRVGAPTVRRGDLGVIIWATSNVNGCLASGGWSGSREPSGVETVGPLVAATAFALVCTGAGGTVESTTQITVISDGGS